MSTITCFHTHTHTHTQGFHTGVNFIYLAEQLVGKPCPYQFQKVSKDRTA